MSDDVLYLRNGSRREALGKQRVFAKRIPHQRCEFTKWRKLHINKTTKTNAAQHMHEQLGMGSTKYNVEEDTYGEQVCLANKQPWHLRICP